MDEIFRKAARSALVLWELDDDLEDLINDLWVWYLESPETQRKIGKLSKPEAITTVRLRCSQILSERVLAGNTFKGHTLYSVDSVKQALLGTSSNKHLREALPIAMEAVQLRDAKSEHKGRPREYAEAIRSRYTDDIVPLGADADRLSKALKSLTDEINVGHLTSNKDDVSAEHPSARRPKGQHSDPTANIALLLIEHPEVRDDYLEETTFEAQLKGENAQPVRLDVERNATVRDVPGISHPGAVSV